MIVKSRVAVQEKRKGIPKPPDWITYVHGLKYSPKRKIVK
jgi:hypothetical protein